MSHERTGPSRLGLVRARTMRASPRIRAVVLIRWLPFIVDWRDHDEYSTATVRNQRDIPLRKCKVSRGDKESPRECFDLMSPTSFCPSTYRMVRLTIGKSTL